MDKEKRNKIIDLIVKIILIIIIVILLIHNCVLQTNKNNKPRETTGNIEIIEIKCDTDNKCDVVPKDKGEKSNDNKSTDNSGGTSNQTITDGDLTVLDKGVTWSGTTDVKIFTNSMYTIDDLIAPESDNTYQFIVKNGTSYNLKYNIEFLESNPYNINMKYKLKKNDTYLVDHYVTASELNVSNMLLNLNSNDTYYLEWKWISNSNDTEIGANPESKYGLKINVKAESNNG